MMTSSVATVPSGLSAELLVLSVQEWTTQHHEHVRAADLLTADHRRRRAEGLRHPVWDFLFTYYPTRPNRLRRWTPGVGVGVEITTDSPTPPLPGPAKFYREMPTNSGPVWTVDLDAVFTARGRAIALIHRLLTATMARTPRFSCFGMHEWAMVYQDAPRHPEPLRLGATRTNQVVDSAAITCTHYDAFRFFTPHAVELNSVSPTRETQRQWEQPGCLHATMDLYKWATKLGPLIPGDLWLDTFRLAADIRATDMEASPYDLTAWGFDPILIETAAGRAEYARRQKSFAARGQVLRGRMINLVEQAYPSLNAKTSVEPPRSSQ